MTFVKKLRLMTAIFGVTAGSAALGLAVYGDISSRPTPTPARAAADPLQSGAEAARTKFSALPTVTYRTAAGETVFAWQVKPQVAAQPARPRDVLVMIDTSASQAGAALDSARHVLEGLAKDLAATDRVDVWTLNINNPTATRSLTNGFVAPTAEAVAAAITRLADSEYGSGAVDLPAGLDLATKAFEQAAGRSQTLLFLGDGESAASRTPLTEAARVELGHKLADKEVAFIAVPLGAKVDAENLHGLAMLTGGAVVRLTDPILTPAAQAVFAGKLKAAFDTPILRADRVTLRPEGVELYPTRLPPLRTDRATLLLGATKAADATVAMRIEGRVGSTKTTVELSEKLATPSSDHYFLASMLDQYRTAGAKDTPAMLAAERTLAMAGEQYRLFRDEFTVQGVWAISADRLDHAEKLFQAALKIDPQGSDALSGLRVVTGLRGGNLTADAVKMGLAKGTHISRVALPQVPGAEPKKERPEAAAPPAVGPTPAERNLIDQAKNAQAVLEQEYRILVDETLRRARRLLSSDPDAAYEDLKRQRETVLNNEQLSDATRRRLASDLESAMREVTLKGSEIKRTLASQRERIAQSRQRLNEFEQRATQEEQTRARIDSFRQLMSQARFELAQQEAQVMIQERISRGQTVIPEATASYKIGQQATNLRELTELKRLRENNFLLTMLQVEKSFVPYPDEPPVHFPPAAVWRELTGSRVEKYSNSNLGPDAPASFKRLRNVLEGFEGKKVSIKAQDNLSLDALIATLTDEFRDEGVRFAFRQDLFPADFKPGEVKIKTRSDLSGLPLGTYLDTVLRDAGMSWIARPEYIEIGPNDTTYSLRYDDKVTRVFDVAELIVGIPNAQSNSALLQNLQFLGQQATIFGTTLQPISGLGLGAGGLGALGIGGVGIGGGLGGALGGGLGVGGGLGALGGGGAGLGGMGGGGFGLGGGAMGAGGALQGAAGGNQGQLGSQFTIQGNDQSNLLVQLITSVVARGEWDRNNIGGLTQQQLAGLFPAGTAEETGIVDARKLNTLGFYPPARALIIRGSHRYHASPSFNLKRGEPMAAGGQGLPGRGQFAANNAAAKPQKPDDKAVAAALVKQGGQDQQKLWNAVLGGAITRQEVVIDAADMLFEMNEFGHASEVLKASLRKGRANGIWTHDALAIALKSSHGSAGEVERASLSGIDMDPTSSAMYLQAAKAEDELGNHDAALAYCQRAAAIEPNAPDAYVNALTYANRVSDVKSDAVQWAAANLLQRDWPADDQDYHATTKHKVGLIAARMAGKGRAEDAAKLQGLTAEAKTRDIVIEMLYQGRADLDLVVTEPTGSVCSATHKRTTNGGLLKSDILEQRDEDRSESYVAASAFPGTYRVLVKKVLGTPIANSARVKVTKNAGTPTQSVEVFSVDLSAGDATVTTTLAAGTRKDLASVPEEAKESQLESTQAVETNLGPAGGIGDRFTTVGTYNPTLPSVKPTTESRIPSVAAGVPGMRLETKLTADRKNVVMSAKPVFAGPATDIATPKIELLPKSGS